MITRLRVDSLLSSVLTILTKMVRMMMVKLKISNQRKILQL